MYSELETPDDFVSQVGAISGEQSGVEQVAAQLLVLSKTLHQQTVVMDQYNEQHLEHLRLQNALLAALAWETNTLGAIEMCADGDVPNTEDFEMVCHRAATMMDILEREGYL